MKSFFFKSMNLTCSKIAAKLLNFFLKIFKHFKKIIRINKIPIQKILMLKIIKINHYYLPFKDFSLIENYNETKIFFSKIFCLNILYKILNKYK